MIDMRIKSMFFDRQKVIRATDKASRAALSKAGAFIRQSARTSIRPRKGVSPPGSPPYSHTGNLRRRILFGYDASSKSVVVGPLRFKQGEAPPLLEFGGRAKRITRKGKKVTAVYRPRPFMGPALEREAPKLPPMWSNSVKSET